MDEGCADNKIIKRKFKCFFKTKSWRVFSEKIEKGCLLSSRMVSKSTEERGEGRNKHWGGI